MAVDGIPDPSEKLKQVLYLRKRIPEISSEIQKAEEEHEFIRAITKRKLDWSLENCYEFLNGLRMRAAHLSGLLSRLPNLCYNCDGKQSHDYWNERGVIARVCTVCKGTGLETKKGLTPFFSLNEVIAYLVIFETFAGGIVTNKALP